MQSSLNVGWGRERKQVNRYLCIKLFFDLRVPPTVCIYSRVYPFINLQAVYYMCPVIYLGWDKRFKPDSSLIACDVAVWLVFYRPRVTWWRWT